MSTRPLWIRLLSLALALAIAGPPAWAGPLTHAQALAALARPNAAKRLAGVERLGTLGTMADAGRLLPSLADDDERVRAATVAALWQIWGRSGDPKIDRLYARGLAQMQAAELTDALATFDQIVARKPAFAEGWNKRATILFLMGENERSLKDCEEVFKRNPNHFGALAGAGQIQLQLGNLRLALNFFRQALRVNPNLDGAAQVIPLIEEQLRSDDASRT